ncbi:FGGY-family carbohydrate kinase [Synechocystis sp. LKSZ1]|uniref:FGGY-family carbohydrate kinase n=1 Tax=Synechocystis sp. LKSZ1 TaxID=3144951 RepID=UPI00336BD08B
MAFAGLDFGTSGARLMVINHLGEILWQASQAFLPLPPTAWANHWRETLFSLLSKIPPDIKGQLQALAINGTSSTVLLCDVQGETITEPLLYNDSRGSAVKAQLQSLAPVEHLVQSASSSLAKLLWWSEQDYFPQARYFLHQADWLAALLHGHWGLSDYHNALKLGYDVQALAYPAWLVNASFFSLLPQVWTPGEPIGRIQKTVAKTLNLSPDCWICAGTTDSIAAFLASGASQPGEAVTSLGSTLVLKLLSETYGEDLVAGVYSHRLGNYWLMGGASNAGGAILRHFFQDEELAQLSLGINPEVPSPYDYYPLLRPGERFPINDPELEPRLTPRPEDPATFLQGLLEGLVRIEALGYQTLQRLGASPLQRVYTAGGGAKNITWQVIRARHLQVPVLISSQTEAAYGTAHLAQQGLQRLNESLRSFPKPAV